MSTSAGVMPAMAKASGPDLAAAETVRSGIWLMCQWVWLSAAPRMRMGFFAASRARAAVVTMQAPPPSVTRQMSLRCSGSLIGRAFRQSSMVSGSRDQALGFFWAQSRAATAISASWARVVPYWCMWRAAISA